MPAAPMCCIGVRPVLLCRLCSVPPGWSCLLAGRGAGAASEVSYIRRPLPYGLLVTPPISGSLGAFSHA